MAETVAAERLAARKVKGIEETVKGARAFLRSPLEASMTEKAKIVTVDLKRKPGVPVGTVTEVDRTTGVTETVPWEQARANVLGKRVNVAKAE